MIAITLSSITFPQNDVVLTTAIIFIFIKYYKIFFNTNFYRNIIYIYIHYNILTVVIKVKSIFYTNIARYYRT